MPNSKKSSSTIDMTDRPADAEATTPSGSRGGSGTETASTRTRFTVAGLEEAEAGELVGALQARLVALIDLGLTLKHIHWNVVGPQFIAVHEMLDPQVDGVLLMVDAVAERVTTLGGSPNGLAGHLVAARSWEDYALARGSVPEHLGALDLVYVGVTSGHRAAIEKVGDIDPVTEDLLIGQLGKLELYHWFVRAHLESTGGELSTKGARTEEEAARRSADQQVGARR